MNKHHDYNELAFPASPDTLDTRNAKGADACFFYQRKCMYHSCVPESFESYDFLYANG